MNAQSARTLSVWSFVCAGGVLFSLMLRISGFGKELAGFWAGLWDGLALTLVLALMIFGVFCRKVILPLAERREAYEKMFAALITYERLDEFLSDLAKKAQKKEAEYLSARKEAGVQPSEKQREHLKILEADAERSLKDFERWGRMVAAFGFAIKPLAEYLPPPAETEGDEGTGVYE